MDKAIIAFSFDDGRLDNYTNAYSILKKYGLPATFNITTGYIKGVIDKEKFEFPEPMTIEMVKEIFENGNYEIAGHGNQHINTVEDIVSGINELCEILHTRYLWGSNNGFASPGSDLTESMYNSMKVDLDSNRISYIRVSCCYKNNRHLKVFFRKLSRILKWPWIYRLAFQDSLITEVDKNRLYSIPVLASATIGQVKALLLQAIKEKKACILMFHSIVPRNTVRNTWDYPSETFEAICKMLSDFQSKNMLEVKTVMDLYDLLKNLESK